MSEAFEIKHVHDVYAQISDSFDGTRHKMWPRVHKWQSRLPDKSRVADIGCGNGKNMQFERLKYRGCDMCPGLLEVCRTKGLDVCHGNVLEIPFETESFDAVMCIAVLHHLSTPERRREGIIELLRICRSGGTVLISVWAFEQDSTSRRVVTQPEMMMPWKGGDVDQYRYYHMFQRDELEALFVGLSCEIKIYYEASNWYVEVIKL